MVSDGVARIFAQARQLFYERGFDATSMQDIADALGLHKSTLYHHISSKDELLEAACRETLDRLEASLDAVLRRADLTAGERLQLAFDGAVSVALDDVVGTNVVISQRNVTDVGRTVNAWRRRYDQRFTDLVSEAQAAGDMRADIDPSLFTRVLLGAINWVVTWYRPGQDRFEPGEVRHAIASIVGGGLFHGAASGEPDALRRVP
jgi:AcrR family transcriptional regulator